MRIQSKYLDEKLTAADPTSKWIRDFVDSDNPKFAGKSKKERIRMALGASYAAKGQSRNEETYSDTGWKKPQTQAKTKNVSQNLARKAMKQSEKETKKEKGFGPSPADKLSIRKEEVEELDELKKSTLGSYVKKAQMDKSFYAADIGRMGSSGDTSSSSYNNVKRQHKNRGVGIDRAVDRLTKEEVELDEGKYGAFRLGPGVGRFSSRGKAQHQGLEDPRTGLPLGFSNPPKKDEPKKDEPKKVKEEVVLEMDKSQPASSRGAEGLPLGKKAEPAKTDKVKSDALKALQKQYKKVKEEVELDELDQSTLTKYATRAKFSSDPKHRDGAAKAQEKINKKSKDMQKEEAEQVDEVLDSAGKVMSYATKATVSGLKSAVTGTRKFRKRQAGIQTALRKTKEKIANEEVDESIGSTVGSLIGQYAGSKIGMEGPGRVGGGVAGRAIEYHVRKFANKLKKKITGKNESVEVEEDNKAYRAQDKASRETTGMSLQQRSKMYDDIQKKLKDQEEEYRKQGILPPKNEEVELDEISQNTALNAYAKRAERAATTKNPKDQEKADKSITRIGKRWTADAQRRAWNRADKLIYKEETELEEDGKLKGGGKDPCWKGYQMVGTKKKNGREVPNCVPREGKEYKSFKELREELNGDSNRS